ncbi:MAG: alpha/beta hydrolase family protein [Frankiales bacterium]|nr:alpha/beta hydrolase family protein [Frankiales bacterium]
MASRALVLVHGGQHTGRCWQPTIDSLARLAPDVRVLAVDLPGRGATPGDLATLTIGQCVDSVLAQIEAAGLDEVVLVGHSMAGLTVPGVAVALGPERVRRLVMVACCVPQQGRTIVDTLAGPFRVMAARAAQKGKPAKPMPKVMANLMFCNGMTKEQKAFVHSQLCGEASTITAEPVDRSQLSAQIPRSWVIPLRDRSLRPAMQRRFIDNLGGVEDVVEIDACHDVMVSHPEELAAVLAARC